ncbi:helix-turn-helix domain-containing protein [Mediterraneibacter glycyrrhizinilyticus]|uniref:helix-turn-helix domain-containing protein n=1 Tax=Mediterraneibacter glycyrrhizinilyticus TaxID=342942 RepID=UPI0025A4BDFF|nr:helix-turn-helix transcriptional regulator [Mediterraneibacter glycyrrhizinilyticus]MDM8124227.1 helix-turn-helix transcriptional regulator [Mediterraneibacter glycyrrhizinilyticus]MDM8209561.1 helix-turn-helix transcriptional regulator [Mediterraneibacter glycyrrhizinilyticus]
MPDVLERITFLRMKRGWTEYQLAEESGLTQSTISSWYRRNMVPSIPSLEKICSAFGITLSQFFAGENDSCCNLTDFQKEVVEEVSRLSKEQQATLLSFLKTL